MRNSPRTCEHVFTICSSREIVDFMVTRYGDFVLYRPPVKSTTVFLWYGPFIALVIGVLIVLVYMRKQKQQKTVVDIPEQQQQRAHSLLDDE